MILRIKNYLAIALFIVSFASCTNKSQKKEAYQLVWADEFDYNGLPDAAKWDYEEGFVRNKEAQYFTKARINNAEVKDGKLHIKALKENYKGAEYTSASVITRGIHEFTYGRVEIMAKVPHGKGVWPALWTLGTNIDNVGWPLCGEIDILEFVGHDSTNIHVNIHTKKYNHNKGTNIGTYRAVDKPWEDFHLYTIDWQKDKIDWYFDNEKVFTAKNTNDGIEGWPFNDASQYLIMNLAIGGTWGGEQGIDDSMFPHELVIDYIRYYSSDQK